MAAKVRQPLIAAKVGQPLIAAEVAWRVGRIDRYSEARNRVIV
jgi:hypothetical protein